MFQGAQPVLGDDHPEAKRHRDTGIEPPDCYWLKELSALQLQNAVACCSERCRPYHAAWCLLRYTAILPSVGRDHTALTTGLVDAVESGARKVLISGAADAGILAYVLDAFGRVGVQGDITVVDQCQTPLASNTWYAVQRGHAIQCFQEDIRFHAQTGYDLIVAHSFMNFFPAQERVEVAQAWFRYLGAGGHLLLIGEAKPKAPPRAPRFGQENAEKLANKAAAVYTSLSALSDLGSSAVHKLAYEFAMTRNVHSVRSRTELTGPLELAGFKVVEASPIKEDQVQFPGKDEGIRYRILAQKRLAR